MGGKPITFFSLALQYYESMTPPKRRLPFFELSFGMDPLHATVEEFAAEGFTHSNATALDVA